MEEATMAKRLKRIIGMTVLTSVLGLFLTVPVGSQQQTPPKGRGERHPHIHAAMKGLRQAARQLGEADHDFGGHRVKALELVKQAEGELREALEYAKAHPEEFKGAAKSGASKPPGKSQ
jgi:hypothetical protein